MNFERPFLVPDDLGPDDPGRDDLGHRYVERNYVARNYVARNFVGRNYLRRLLLLSLLAGAGEVLVPVAAEAQCTTNAIPGSCSLQRGPYRSNVRKTVWLTVSPNPLVLPSPDHEDYLQGFSQAAGHAVEVKANANWSLLIRASQTNWTGTAGGRTNKPRADLQWGLTDDLDGDFTSMTGNNAAANVEVTSGGPTDGEPIQLYYRVLWSWTLDRPGIYTIPVVITLSAP